jgi:N-acyl-D-amino-acid deacylase
MNRRPSSGLAAIVVIALILAGCSSPHYDTIIRHGTIYDGTGGPPITGDLAIRGDTIAAIGDLGKATGTQEIDAQGLAVAPGFINMLMGAPRVTSVRGSRSRSWAKGGRWGRSPTR